MIKVRLLDQHHDWQFGHGNGSYAHQSQAIAQSVKTRLWSFVDDWFLDLDHGLPWLTKVERGVDLTAWEFRIKRQVLETAGVIRIDAYHAQFDPHTRQLSVQIHYTDQYHQAHQLNSQIQQAVR